MKPKNSTLLAALAASTMFYTWTSIAANAATLTWDAASGDGESITAGSGDWNTTATNWNNAGTNEAWSQTSATAALHAAVFAGSDGAANEYVVTLSGTVNAQSVTFNNTGYQLSGGTLILRPTSTTNGGITVAANKTATINSLLQYSNNAAATNVINAGATLNLGGGANNSQYTFNGAGSVNITGGNYEANIGAINVGSFNISGGTYNLTPGASNGYTFGAAVARNVNVNVSGTGTLTLNNTGTNSGATAPFIAIGNNTDTTANTTSLTVQSGGTVTVATQSGRAGEIRISNSGNANGLMDVQGGTVNVGSGNANNKIYLFKNGGNDGYSARYTQSGGVVTTNGIQFGGSTGATTYGTTASSSLELSGGSLYIGAAGITKGSDATGLASTIKLEGGTLGADQNWSSALDMQLGTAGGGVSINAQSAGGTSRNITLSGILSNVSGVSGSLVKTGSGILNLSGENTFDGGLTIQNGTVNATTTNAALGAGTVTMGGAGSTGATLTTGRVHANNFTINAPDSGVLVIGANGAGSGYTLSGGITLNGNLVVRTFNNTISGTIKAGGTITGGITGTGNVLLNNLGLAANTITFNTGAINHTGSLTLQGTATGDTTINASIGSNVTSVTQNSATSRLILAGNNAYTGDTNVNAGTLVVTGNISTSSMTTVASGATVMGSGTVSALTINSGGTLAPGTSIESLASGDVTLLAGAIYQQEIDKSKAGSSDSGDLLAVTGSLTLSLDNDSILNLIELGESGAWSVGNKITLISYSGEWNGGLFTYNDSVLSNNSTFTFSDMLWQFKYDDTGFGDNYQADLTGPSYVTMTAIPEPGAALLGGLGLLALLRRRRDA